MFAWLRHLFRAHELPDDPKEPVHVDVIGTVVSPNAVTSPITGLTASLLEIVLVDWETLVTGSMSLAGESESERFTALGGVRWGGPLAIADAKGRVLTIGNIVSPRVLSVAPRPMVLDSAIPRELFEVARKSRHLLSYREVRFREGDRVRVLATVQSILVPSVGGGYRGGVERALVPVEGEPLELREML